MTSAGYQNELGPGAGPHAPNGQGHRDLAEVFRLPDAIYLPGDHREVERLAEAGRHVEAADAIGELRFSTRVDRNRASIAQAICLMRAGRHQTAAEVLESGRRTMASAWYLACSLVRLDRLQDAAAEVLWLGERTALLGNERRAAQALLGHLGRPLPLWLVDPGYASTDRQTHEHQAPPLSVASFFHPPRPEVPAEFRDVAEAIQQHRFIEAARRLIAYPADDPRIAHRIAVATAECWLLADRPAAAEAWLGHRRSIRGVWALACAYVQQNRLVEALEPLAWLARQRSLGDEQREAASVLVAHLGLEAPPAGLEVLDGHPYLVPCRAQEAGYRRFTEEIVRKIGIHSTPEEVEPIVQRVVAQCMSVPEGDARRVLVPTYEAAVRTSSSSALAEQGLSLLLSRPDLLGSDHTEYSRALLFATACDRLEELHHRLDELGERQPGQQERFASWLAAAKLSLVLDDAMGVIEHAARARKVAITIPDRERALRLRRAARWLTTTGGSRISEWRLRQVHHLLPRDVAERLEDRDDQAQQHLELLGSRSVDAASRYRHEAAAIARNAGSTVRQLREALGWWALHVGRALLDASRPGSAEPVPFTGAAWSLLSPDPPGIVADAYARAIGIACAAIHSADGVLACLDAAMRAMPDTDGAPPAVRHAVLAAWHDSRREAGGAPHQPPPDLVHLLRPVSTFRPLPPGYLRDVLKDLREIPPEARQVVDECIVDRFALLPSAPPFRGRRWFDSDTAHRSYQQGREEPDARLAYKAFEAAWLREPSNHVTTQGLILGLARRLSEKDSRNHLLAYLARILDQLVDHEVEAALAYATLAQLVAGSRQRRQYLQRAVASLQRRAGRKPWTRARNAEIAIQLELGNLVAAGRTAWEESSQALPGSPASNRYALLAATLWRRSEGAEHSLQHMIRAAEHRSRSPRLTNREAVQHAVTTGRLATLGDLDLDRHALEDLWRACRGDEDDLCRFLEQQGSQAFSARPHYLRFLIEKQERTNPTEAARIRHRFLAPGSAPTPARMAWLRLAAAELLAHDPLQEVATSRYRLCEVPMRQFLAALRDCASDEAVAYQTFHAAAEDALAALFELREAASVSEPEQLGGRLASATEALSTVRRAARRFGTPAVVHVAGMLSRYLSLAVDSSMADAYLREKDKRLAPSRLGLRLGSWWVKLSGLTGPLDFFHLHQSYRCPPDVRPEDWWSDHLVHGRPVRAALEELAAGLEARTRELREIEERYLASRTRRELRAAGFGLQRDLADCCRALRRALAPAASHDDVRGIEGALARLGGSLRRLDLTRPVEIEGLLHDSSVAGCYLLPRASELFDHLRRNAADRCLRFVFEVRDDSGRDVLCLVCLDEGALPAPESASLRGLARFADLVEALGGQFHLWMSRPGERSGCRREHGRDSTPCAADEYVARIEDRLRLLATDRWHSHRATVEPWLAVLDRALHSTGSATVAFAVLPQLTA